MGEEVTGADWGEKSDMTYESSWDVNELDMVM